MSFLSESSGPKTSLLGIGTAAPGEGSSQEKFSSFLENVARASLAEDEWPRAARLARAVCKKSGVERRYSVVNDFSAARSEAFSFFPKCWSLEPLPTTQDRMKWYERSATELARSAALRALKGARVRASDITHLIVVSCTGFSAPGLDVALTRSLQLRSEVRRRIIGFMGCYAGLNALADAQAIVDADPSSVVLVVSVELCSLHYQRAFDLASLVSNCLFSDGAAAAVIGTTRIPQVGTDARRSLVLLATHSELMEESEEDAMRWDIGDHGFVMRLDDRVPKALERHARKFVAAMARGVGVSDDEIEHWAIHPGGPRIVSSVARALGLQPDDPSVALSLSVLQAYGNMSSATIFFVLERLLQEVKSSGLVGALGFGPGLTVEGALFYVQVPPEG